MGRTWSRSKRGRTSEPTDPGLALPSLERSEATERRRAAGRAARRAGLEFEQYVDGWLTALEQARLIAWWQANHPGKIGARFVEAAGADRGGFLARGTPFALEVKSTQPGDDFHRRRVTEKQARHLDAVARAGGPALLALQFRAWDGVNLQYLVPWEVAPWRRLRTQDVLRAADLEDFRVLPGMFAASFRARIAAGL
jgi:hypothetical protein